jgi:hypothetical protein
MLIAFIKQIVSDVCKKEGRKTGVPVAGEIASDEWKKQ